MSNGNQISLEKIQQMKNKGDLVAGNKITIAQDAHDNLVISGENNQVTIIQQIISDKLSTKKTNTPDNLQNQNIIPTNPYLGLAAFQEKDAKNFFGRERLSAELWQKFRKLQNEQLRLLPILGPSGSGKSSLARAGLLPLLAMNPIPKMQQMQVAVFTPGARPWEALALVLARIASGDPSPVAKTQEFVKAMQTDTENGLQTIIAALPGARQTPLLLLVDQFEESYTLCQDKKKRDQFIQHLLKAASDNSKQISIVLTLRSDFLGETQKNAKLNQHIARHGVIIPAMDEMELSLAISQPALQSGSPFEPAIISLLLEQSNDRDGILPQLQFALSQIWQALPQDPAKTLQDLGGVGGALAKQAKHLFENLTARQKTIARRAFLKMVQLGDAGHHTRRRAYLSEMLSHNESINELREVLEQFASKESRLISLSAEIPNTQKQEKSSLLKDANKYLAEITHEALLQHWQELNLWLEHAQDDLRFERRLNEAIIEWTKQGKPFGLLWSTPEQLNPFESYYASHKHEMTSVQIEFFQACQDNKKNQRRQKFIVIWSIIILLLSIAFGGYHYADNQKQARIKQEELTQIAKNNEQKALITQSLFLADFARQYNQKDLPATAMRLALEALPHKNNPFPERPFVIQAQQQLYNAWVKFHQGIIEHDEAVEGAMFSPSGHLFLTYSGNNIYLWDIYSNQLKAVLKGHKDSVNKAIFSPNGDKIISISKTENRAYLWDANNGQNIAKLDGHKYRLTSAVFSPDGATIATASKDNSIRLWNSNNGQHLTTLKSHQTTLSSASFSPDSSQIVAASEKSTAKIWDSKNGQTLTVLKGHQLLIYNATFSPDGTRIVTVSRDETARLWDSKNGQLIHGLSGHKEAVTYAAFNSDGNRIITQSDDQTARLWNSQTGQTLAILEENKPGFIISAKFSPDDTRIITRSWDNMARIWDGKNGQFIATLSGHESIVTSVEFSPDGSLIATTSIDNTARIWDSRSGQQLAILNGHQSDLLSVSFSPDQHRIITTSLDKTARLWNVRNGHSRFILAGHTHFLNGASYSIDGTKILTSSWDKTARLWDAKIWDAKSGTLLKVLGGNIDRINRAIFSPDGKQIFATYRDKTGRIWDTESGQNLTIFDNLHKGRITSTHYSPDGSRIVTASTDRSVRIWDSKSGLPIAVLNAHSKRVNSAVFHPDGKQVVTASSDKSARLWDSQSGRSIAVLNHHNDKVNHAVFSPNGKQIVTASRDKTARVWDSQSGKNLVILKQHKKEVVSANFSPDGSRIVTASKDHSARLWDSQSGQSLAVLSGHKSFLTSAVFSPDGTKIITASKDKTARLWDAKNGQALAVLKGHKKSVNSAVFSPDSKFVITASNDHTARLWPVFNNREDLISQVYSVLPRKTLNCQERQDFFLSCDENKRKK